MTASPLDPRQLARDADAPLAVVRFLFAAAEDDPTLVRLIRGGALDQETVKLRRAIILVSKLHAYASLPQIGRALNRDHSSIQRSLNEAIQMLVEDASFRALCRQIVQTCARFRSAA
ncbi:hypothetical protein CVO77_03625 [Sphingopyxis lindanitolerans]|uniref:Uncharacterized protein n=1 Tax=Sphingopyxis lindanitolerans TaxID=2054227 RepID=A0A2S8B5J0_9SPHN|nr:hypothetical protein [Sphingopyxis lindanitolerans]PQM27672.1 hypothetical protein CVO77_03625 [Sphingopyxis lindanitolerans]